MDNSILKSKADNRIEYFDFFRAIAVYAIIIIHTDSLVFYTTDLRSVEWQIINIFDSMTRWAVPVFMMISGALFLRSTSSTEKILTKNVLRIVTAFLFWSSAYALISVFQGRLYGKKEIILQVLTGHYHMWYLQLIACLYVATPVLRKLVKHEDAVNYALLVCLLLSMLVPQIMETVSLFYPGFAEIGQEIQNKLNTGIFHGGLFYFLCGYELCRREIGPKLRRWIYALGILGLLYTIVFTSAASVWKGQPINSFYTPYRINSALMAIAVFVFGKYHFSYSKTPKLLGKIVSELSKKSFGIYLVHVMVIESLDRHFNLAVNPIVELVIISLAVLLVSYVITAAIQKIPVLKKYIV